MTKNQYAKKWISRLLAYPLFTLFSLAIGLSIAVPAAAMENKATFVRGDYAKSLSYNTKPVQVEFETTTTVLPKVQPVETGGRAKEVYKIAATFSPDREEAREAVIKFSEQYGADVDLALCIVKMESGFNKDAKNPHSSASGIWQFIDSTWLSTAKRMGKDWTLADKTDMMKNAEAGAWLLAHDSYGHWVVWPKCVK